MTYRHKITIGYVLFLVTSFGQEPTLITGHSVNEVKVLSPLRTGIGLHTMINEFQKTYSSKKVPRLAPYTTTVDAQSDKGKGVTDVTLAGWQNFYRSSKQTAEAAVEFVRIGDRAVIRSL